MHIRIAGEQDRQFLIREYVQHFSPDLQDANRFAALYLQVDRALVLEEDGFIFGILLWGIREGIRDGLAQITWLHIISSRHRQGLGRKLFEFAVEDMEQYFSAHGARLRRIYAFVPGDAEVAIAFSQGLGLRAIGELPDHRETGRVELLCVWDK